MDAVGAGADVARPRRSRCCARFRAEFDLDQEYDLRHLLGRRLARWLAATRPPSAGRGRRARDRLLDPREPTGAGLATEAAAALTRVAIEICGVDRVEIHVDTENTSQPRRSNANWASARRRRCVAGCRRWTLPDPPRDEVVFTLHRGGAAVVAGRWRSDFEAFDPPLAGSSEVRRCGGRGRRPSRRARAGPTTVRARRARRVAAR